MTIQETRKMFNAATHENPLPLVGKTFRAALALQFTSGLDTFGLNEHRVDGLSSSYEIRLSYLDDVLLRIYKHGSHWYCRTYVWGHCQHTVLTCKEKTLGHVRNHLNIAITDHAYSL